jgi:ParB-like chromosome segregation protein Spo0J
MDAARYVKITDLREHELQAELSPWMSEKKWVGFLDGIAHDGILQPVIALPDGRIVDGKHRLRAARELGLAEIRVIYEDVPEEQVAKYIEKTKLERDDLTKGQRACIVLNSDEAQRVYEDAKQREYLGVASNDARVVGKSAAILGKKIGVSQAQMERLMAVKRKRPDLYAKVFSGEYTIGRAHAEMKRDEAIANGETTQAPREDLRKKAEEAAEIAQQRADTAPPVDESESSLSPANIIRYKVKHEMPTFVRHLAFDYELLDQSDDETVSAYMGQVKLLVECGLRLLERYELREAERAIYAASLQLFEHSKSEESIKKVEMMEEEYEDEK